MIILLLIGKDLRKSAVPFMLFGDDLPLCLSGCEIIISVI